jgi:hypothetical protein
MNGGVDAQRPALVAMLGLLLGLDDAERDAVLGINARRFYGAGDD